MYLTYSVASSGVSAPDTVPLVGMALSDRLRQAYPDIGGTAVLQLNQDNYFRGEILIAYELLLQQEHSSLEG